MLPDRSMVEVSARLATACAVASCRRRLLLSWHVAALTLDNLDELPKRCRRCVFWELSSHLAKQAAGYGSVDLEKEAWVSEVLLEWGSCGKIVYVRGVPAGYVIYAPPSAVPRAAEMPTGPVSADAVLLTTMQVMPELCRYQRYSRQGKAKYRTKPFMPGMASCGSRWRRTAR